MPGTNLIGPYGSGVNESYDTPDFGDSGGSEFSWFVDCSDDVTDDGTKWTARWANRVMLQLRRAVVGMGIPLNEVDGDSLYKAILKAHRPIVNIGGGAALHKGEKMPEWQHELRSLVGAGTVTVNVVGDTVVITGAAGSSVTLQSLGAGVPVYKGVAGSVHQFRSLMAELGVEVEATTNEAVFRLAPQPGWSIMLRNAASSGRPTGVRIDELTEETAPSVNDWTILQRASDGALRKAKRSAVQVGIKVPVALVTATWAFGSPAFTPVFGCSQVSGGQFLLNTPLAVPCIVAPALSSVVGAPLSNAAASVIAQSPTGFTVGLSADGTDVSAAATFVIYG